MFSDIHLIKKIIIVRVLESVYIEFELNWNYIVKIIVIYLSG